MMDTLVSEVGIVAALVVGLGVALEIGYRVGRAARSRRSGDGGQLGVVQGATLGLLGLLLGFSFAGAAGRFMERQDLIIQEANQIGTAYLRAKLLDEPHASRVRQTLAQYVQHRIEASRPIVWGLSPEAAVQIARFHDDLWSAASDGVLAKPQMALTVLNPVNGVIDIHSTRVAAGRKHLPAPVLSLLIACSLLAVAVIGYGSGMAGGRSLFMNASLVLLIAAALWITIDLDHPRAGIIRLSDQPLQHLQLQMHP